ncbi:MAG: dihydropyrimidinase [Oscillibacter sp.]|jgi:dihydropyrimidinase|nr:dihydropyrimidinase [Oscillibacter sp.]
MLDLIVKNGTLVTADATFQADIGVQDEKISVVAAPGTLKEAKRVVDAKGKYVMPGMIEPHMHVAAPFGGTIDVLDFYSASKCAAFGGVTSFMDFSSTVKGMSVLQAVKDRREEMSHAALDYGVHAKFVEANERVIGEVKQLIDYGVPTFKMFTTYPGVMIEDRDILEVLKEAAANGGLCGFHAESNPIAEFNRDNFAREGKLDWKYFPEAKPNACEAEAVQRILTFAEYLDAPVYFFHLSTKESMKLVREAKARGVKVLAETCTHYLTLTKAKNDGPDGVLYLMSPPLRTKEDQAALWGALQDGTLSLVTSDNEAFTREQKESFLDKDANGKPIIDFRKPVNGTPGLEERFGLMMAEGVNRGRIGLNKLVELCSTNPAKVFGCYPQKGCLDVGSDADIILVDPDKAVKLTKENLHYGLQYSLYEDFEAKGWPVMTIRRGEVLVEDGKFLGKEGTGRFLKRAISR